MAFFNRVKTFDEARQLRNPPPLVTYVEFDTGAGRVTVEAFESTWRAVSTLGAAQVTAVSFPVVEGTYANEIFWDSANALTVVATTLATGIDLSGVETVRFFVRSTETGLPMRVGLGQASSGEFLPDIAPIVTANAYVERQFSLDAVPPDERTAIKKLRFELYGETIVGAGTAKGTGRTYLDNMHAVKRSRYANIFTAKPGVIIPGEPLDVTVQGAVEIITDGHAMDDTTLMDDASTMTDGTIIVSDGSQVPATDLSGQNAINASFSASDVPATLRFGFGEATYSEHTFDFTIATANVSVSKVFDISAVTASARDAVQFFGLIPLAVPTTNPNFTCSMDSLVAQRYFNPSPIVPYRVFHEKLTAIQPIVHSIGPVQSAARIANTTLSLDNHDSEFYSLLGDDGFLNRHANVFLGFQDFPDSESQVAFRGIVRREVANDESYTVSLEDLVAKTIRDLPPNLIVNKQYAFPGNYAGFSGFTISHRPEVSNPTLPPSSEQGQPIPLGFGHTYVRMRMVYKSFNVSRPGDVHSVGFSAWVFNDRTFGKTKRVINVVYRNQDGEWGQWGSEIANIATDVITLNGTMNGIFAGWHTDYDNGIIYVLGGTVADNDSPVAELWAEIEGYEDDSLGTWTGTPEALIDNPADVVRFLLLNVLALDPGDVDLHDLDSARTALKHVKVARGISERQSAFELIGGRAGVGGLASNVMSYFFSSNVSGKLRFLHADTSVPTSGTYRATGPHASILRGSYRIRSQPERILTRVEVQSEVSVVSASDRSFALVADEEAESYLRTNTVEPIHIAGKWLPRDFWYLTVGYSGTYTNEPSIDVVNDDNYNTASFRFLSNATGESFDLLLGGPSADTVQTFINTLNAKSYLSVTLHADPVVNIATGIDARGIRLHPKSQKDLVQTFDAFNSQTQSFSVSVNRIQGMLAYSFVRRLACEYLDKYNHNTNAVHWKTPWIGFQQELGQFVDVRSLGDIKARTVRILETRRDPMAGTVEFMGEEIEDES